MSYVEAILWVAAGVAEGLAHAHERGVVHRDLKPANVLLTDDGTPMLLDFNLSEDARARPGDSTGVGGTLPYMAPEHLRAFRGEAFTVDARSDLYSLGVILYELLGGRHPFPRHKKPCAATLERMLAERQAGPPSLRRLNKMVPPAVWSIVRHCLEPAPERRYQSARQLLEDLDNHRDNLPLRHAPNPSLRERGRKWLRRNRLLACCCLVAGAVLVVALALGVTYRARESARERSALAIWNEARPEMRQAQLDLQWPVRDRTRRAAAIARGRAALDRYGALDDPSWHRRADVRYLPEGERAALAERVQELLLELARAATLQAEAEPGRRQEHLEQAWHFNLRAEAACPGPFPHSGLLQRAELAKQFGRPEEGERLRREANEVPLRTARDYLLRGKELAAQFRFEDALKPLLDATRLDGENYWAWFALGNCRFALDQYSEAGGCYGHCISLAPGAYHFYYRRALTYHHEAKFDLARQDLDKAIELAPGEPALHVARGVVLQDQGRHAQALADFDRALDMPGCETRAYFLRARSRQLTGDAAGANRDREEGLRRRPADAASWVVRGVARLPKEPDGALADFEEALRCDPRHLHALQSKASVLVKYRRKPEEALKALDQAVAFHPNHPLPLLSRGVLRARSGRADDARADAKDALAKDARGRRWSTGAPAANPMTQYLAANIYALTAAAEPRPEAQAQDKARALELLRQALEGGYGRDFVAHDPDFRSLRDDPAFRELLPKGRGAARPGAQR
jgi:tetratricopeptide (TPR) repeat protein